MNFFSVVLTWLTSNPEVVEKIVLGSILIMLVSTVLMVVAIIKMNPNYFDSSKLPDESWRGRHPLFSILFNVLKSMVGFAFLVTGIAMLVLPGQGLLAILVGISLLDFPGKRKIELSIIRERHVLKAINWIRIRAKQAPVIVNSQLMQAGSPRGETNDGKE